MFSTFILVASIHFLAVASPGPDFAIVSKLALTEGRRSGFLAALGIACGIALHISYCLAGVALVLQHHPLLFRTVKIAGAVYLLWIGAMSLKEAQHERKAKAVEAPESNLPLTKKSAFLKGFATNATNPKATLFFLSVFTQVVKPDTLFVIKLAYGLEMILITLLWFILVATAISHKTVRRLYKKYNWIVLTIFGVILIVIAVKISGVLV